MIIRYRLYPILNPLANVASEQATEHCFGCRAAGVARPGGLLFCAACLLYWKPGMRYVVRQHNIQPHYSELNEPAPPSEGPTTP